MRALITSILLLAVVIAGIWWAWHENEHRYDREILTISREFGLPAGLVKAVVWQESRFHADVRGGHDEIGLMQLQPTTAQEWADTHRNGFFQPEHLLDATTNLQAGCYYLSKIVRRYPRADNPWAYALADYNAGRGNVLRWLKGPAETNSGAFLEAMTFPGTRHYVRAILERSSQYEAEFR